MLVMVTMYRRIVGQQHIRKSNDHSPFPPPCEENCVHNWNVHNASIE